jgi:hypothetical protein
VAPKPRHDLAAQLRVLFHPRVHPHEPGPRFAAPDDACADLVKGPIGRREDQGDGGKGLVEGLLLPQEAVQFCAIVRTDARPENEQVIARDDVRGIELQVAEMFDRFEDGRRGRTGRTVEKLGVNREAARLGERDPVSAYAELLSASEAFRGLARSAIRAPMRPGPAGASPGRARGSSR